ncbi:hypothetical protein HDU76_010090, partial [Blyttiomyces sp. JEL0837]
AHLILLWALSWPFTAFAIYSGGPQGPGDYYYNGTTLTQPVMLNSTNGLLNITLHVVATRFNGFISYNTRAYSYNNVPMIPGPTLNIRPGDKLIINLINDLDANKDPAGDLMNTLHSPNTTNIHTHGLHVDPAIDTVFVEVQPGKSWTYSYDIPSDSPPGLHWYHSHLHGASAIQVMGGLVGAIYISAPLTTTSAALLQLNSMRRILMVAQHFSMSSINNSTDPFRVSTYVDLSSASNMPINASYIDSNYQDIYNINGQFQPKLYMTTGENVVIDIVNAVGDHNLELDIRESVQGTSITTKCTITHIASDGIYFTKSRSAKYVTFVPSTRQSIIISCSSPGTYYFTNVPDDTLRPGFTDNETRFQQNMVTLIVTGTATQSTPFSIDLSTIPRPTWLSDLTNAVATSFWELNVEQPAQGEIIKFMDGKTWLGIGSNCTSWATGRADTVVPDADTNTNCKYMPFYGSQGATGDYRYITKLNAINELLLHGRGKSPHSLHIHVNHFQIVEDTTNVFTNFHGQ